MKDRRYKMTGLFRIGIPILAGAVLFGAQSVGWAVGNNGGIFRPNAHVPGVNVPAVNERGANVQLVQSSEAVFRVNQLEEQIRKLNGQIEELNFQLLQMQEQIRRMQEDNEYRFQELENDKQGSISVPGDDSNSQIANSRVQKEFRVEKRQPSELGGSTTDSGGDIRVVNTKKKPRMIDGVELYEGPPGVVEEDGGELPLGTITFDSLGNVVDTAVGKPIDLTASLRTGNNDGDAANNGDGDNKSDAGSAGIDLTTIHSAKELYELGYDFFQSGDYLNSSKVFADFVERYPDDRKIAYAQFWLGESLFSQSDYEAAAKIFLDTHTNWPEAKIAPQALLKLGVSLAGMEQRELACATYVKVYKKYPNISNAMRKRIKAEQKSAHCLNS